MNERAVRSLPQTIPAHGLLPCDMEMSHSPPHALAMSLSKSGTRFILRPLNSSLIEAALHYFFIFTATQTAGQKVRFISNTGKHLPAFSFLHEVTGGGEIGTHNGLFSSKPTWLLAIQKAGVGVF